MSSHISSGDHLKLGVDLFSLNPVGLLLAQISISSLLVGFTSARSLWRASLLPFMVGASWITIFNSNKMTAGVSWTFVLQYIDLCLLSKWDFESRGPEAERKEGSRTVVDDKRQSKSPQLQDERPESVASRLWRRIHFGIDSTFALRHIGTPQESKNTPHFDEKNPSYVPTRKVFFLRQLLTILRVYLVIDLLGSIEPDRTWKQVEVFARIHEVTKEELIWRFLRVTGFWITVQCLWTGIFTVFSLVAVGCGLSEPRSWRPLFASACEAYSIRRFWGNSWHQVLRRVLGNSASYVCHDVFDIRNDFVARYVKLYLTFLISGLLHVAMDVAGDTPFDEQGSIRFLMTQAVGITVEDAVQSLYRRTRGPQAKSSRPPLWIRMIGMLWTLTFLVWSTPAWFYPEAHRRPMAPIKFSLVRLARAYVGKH